MTRTIRAVIFFQLALVSFSGCGIGKLADSLNQIANKLEGIGTDLANQASDFNSTAERLSEILKDLPQSAATELRVALEQSAQRATQAAGIEARCTADFARRRIAEDINHLAKSFRARALGKPTPERPPREPMVCQPSPSSIRRDRIIQNGTILWDGYDLGGSNLKSSKLTVALKSENGHLTPVDILSHSSTYQLVADLSRVQTLLTPDISRLVLLSGDRVISEVSIELPPGATRESVPVKLSPWGPKVASNRPLNPRNPKADRDFDGNGPKVTWSVGLSLSRDHRQIIASIHYDAIEWDKGKAKPKGDITEASGHWTETVYTAPLGQTIIRIVGDARDAGEYVDATTDVNDFASGKLYSRYVLGGDGKGADVGVHTKIQAEVTGNIEIELEVPPR